MSEPQVLVPCPNCNKGVSEWEACNDPVRDSGSSYSTYRGKCSSCDGTGIKAQKEKCKTCGGEGKKKFKGFNEAKCANCYVGTRTIYTRSNGSTYWYGEGDEK